MVEINITEEQADELLSVEHTTQLSSEIIDTVIESIRDQLKEARKPKPGIIPEVGEEILGAGVVIYVDDFVAISRIEGPGRYGPHPEYCHFDLVGSAKYPCVQLSRTVDGVLYDTKNDYDFRDEDFIP